MMSDAHIHSLFSSDSESQLCDIADRAIELGMKRICITDHYDMDYSTGEFQLETDKYLAALDEVKNSYEGRLRIDRGVEMGLAPHLGSRISEYLSTYKFDYVIGSIHMVQGEDPYFRDHFSMSDEALYQLYFEWALESLKNTDGFHAFGHLDYVVRYGYEKDKEYSYAKYREPIDEILKILVDRQIALEVNAGGIRKGLSFANPHVDVVKRYKELGGELITLGSDAHKVDQMGFHFEMPVAMLKEVGYKYITEFKDGKPDFIKLQ